MDLIHSSAGGCMGGIEKWSKIAFAVIFDFHEMLRNSINYNKYDFYPKFYPLFALARG